MGKVGCVAIVKNEENHIAEWLAWQFVIGFDTVFLLDNSSTDRTAAIARSFAPRRDVRVIDWPGSGRAFQADAYTHAIHLLKAEFEWLAFFDTDEFLVLDPGLNLKSLLEARPEAAIAVPWAIFGSSGHQDPPAGLVIENFLHRAPANFLPNSQVKSIIRPNLTTGPLNPHAFEIQGYYVDILGRFLTWSNPGILNAAPVYEGAKLHHYFTRSWWHWQARLKRGNLSSSRTEQDFHEYDRNEVFDDTALAYAGRVHAELTLLSTPGPTPPIQEAAGAAFPQFPAPTGLRLGIAITTFNRRELVVDLVTKIRDLTTNLHDLIVCEDGSTDGTAEALKAMSVRVVGGTNRGIAWNKNRGIYYLLHISQCDVVLLLDDDIVPEGPGWESEWIEAAWRYGHVNHAHPAYKNTLVAGALTAADPGLASTIPGWALAFNRFTLADIGYMDVRFGRYGHEHSDLSFRALRTGNGGITVREAGGQKALFYVIDGGLKGVPSVTSGTPEELETNGRLLMELGREPVYRHAWRDDTQMSDFLREIAAAAPAGLPTIMRRDNDFASLEAYQQSKTRTASPGAPPALPVAHPVADDGNISRGKQATQSSMPPWATDTNWEKNASAALNGRVDGSRKFHTALEDNPWWQVDLGGFATIREIRIHNTTDETTQRFKNFSLGVSIDGTTWVEIAHKQDDTPLTGGPFIWNGPGPAWARFVRATLLGRDFLHLDQGEVFGTMTNPGGKL